MKCSQCGSTQTSVLDSRESGIQEEIYTRRRRQCGECEHKFTTREYNIQYINKIHGVIKQLRDSVFILTNYGVENDET